tara:strand:+ start:150 stop:515 length:366 start_codon:yes stop_codon:yes gene_type:complete
MVSKRVNSFIPKRWVGAYQEDNFNDELKIGYLYGGNQQYLTELSASLQITIVSLFHYLKKRKEYVDMQEYKEKSKAYSQSLELLEAVNKMQEETNREWIKWTSIGMNIRYEGEPKQRSFNF